MGSYAVPETITYNEALKIKLFGQTIGILDDLIRSVDTNEERKAILGVFQAVPNTEGNKKTDHPFAEYQRHTTMYPRDALKDRVFPLETVEIQGFNTKNDASIESAFLHVGPSADELARSLNAIALTIGRDIYFRNGAYHPETEEGRKTLAHELTHVRQHDEKRITKQTSEQELEAEATGAEATETYEADPIVTVEVAGSLYSFPRSQMSEIASNVAENISQWLAGQKNLRNEEDQLKLLCGYEQWIREHR